MCDGKGRLGWLKAVRMRITCICFTSSGFRLVRCDYCFAADLRAFAPLPAMLGHSNIAFSLWRLNFFELDHPFNSPGLWPLGVSDPLKRSLLPTVPFHSSFSFCFSSLRYRSASRRPGTQTNKFAFTALASSVVFRTDGFCH